MDQLIFFKSGVDLKSSVEKHRFSYTRQYSMTFAQNLRGLAEQLTKQPTALLFYFCDNLSNSDRISISNITKRFEDIKLVLCTHSSFALEAWRLQVFDFQNHPINNKKLQESYTKHLSSQGGNLKSFNVKSSQGLFTIPFKSVNYLRANGNYTLIALTRDKSLLETKQLKHYISCTEHDINMKRVHRSFILNFRNIKSVSKSEITFYNSEKKLPVSLSLAAKIKRILLAR